MEDEIVITILTAVGVAFITSLLIPLIFGPWLEARNSRLLKWRQGDADLADALFEMSNCLQAFALRAKALGLRPDNADADWTYFHGEFLHTYEVAAESGVLRNFHHSGRLQARLQKTSDLLSSIAYSTESDGFIGFEDEDEAYVFLMIVAMSAEEIARAIDPATAPWARPHYVRRAGKYLVIVNVEARLRLPDPPVAAS